MEHVERLRRLTGGVDLSTARCVEIGALNAPMLRRGEVDVTYVDFATTEWLRTQYADDPGVPVDDIVEVDAIWGDQSLSQALGGRRVDVVVAAHVIEHVPDMITWLAEVGEVLDPDRGTLRLVVPDRRYSFDHFRVESRLSDVLDAWLRRARVPQPREVLDCAVHHADVEPGLAWATDLDRSTLTSGFTVQGAIDLANDVLHNRTYHDVHCWVFTPRSFALLMADLSRNDLCELGCEGHVDTHPGELEFFVHLTRMADEAARTASWVAMADALPPEPLPHAARARITELEARLAATEARAEAAEEALAAITASPWWRASGPARTALTRLRQRRETP